MPVQSLIMLSGGAATLIGLVFEPLGRIVGWGAYLPLTWTIRVVEWTADFPYASVPLKLPFWGLAAVYAVIAGLTWLALLSPERRQVALQGIRERLSLKLALGGMALATVVSWFAILQFPDGKLHVVFMDVGQGDAIFIETPGGVQILVDGGPEGSDRDSNNDSVVTRLTYGEVAFLLTDDIETQVERALLRSGAYLHSTVLKVAHHGSDTSSLPAFIEAVQLQVALISVGECRSTLFSCAPSLASLCEKMYNL
jgi:beta-lactamase superfamily II metal-dependent hydrolase